VRWDRRNLSPRDAGVGVGHEVHQDDPASRQVANGAPRTGVQELVVLVRNVATGGARKSTFAVLGHYLRHLLARYRLSRDQQESTVVPVVRWAGRFAEESLAA